MPQGFFDTIDLWHPSGLPIGSKGEDGNCSMVVLLFSMWMVPTDIEVEETSKLRLLTCGVPQASILSPLLFNFYMKLLGEAI